MAIDKIPFDKNGDMLEYIGYGDPDEWRDNKPFVTEMLVSGYERGRSAVRVILQDAATGSRYPMFISDFVDAATKGRIIYGVINGKWLGGKKGSNYGLKLVGE
ncbi:hypothetical protein J2X12_002922 [Pseudarthrobacter oxydans]|uniref:Uncharacterized protein n=1 Tax=Pseudarthrobacter oxydans TaxID=1671 RepID=A0AAW8NE78_PSEOX|nr:hypothetical protein [Pseudarthrobacter oxydans]MDR6794341.1 hypothetical protein [Pseudarthrobacter oxydans]MDR7164884.1 hypothetical protein [Pseudarthrobacter oxydans]